MSRNNFKPLPKEEFDTLKQEVNKQAAEYAKHGQNIRLREQIWLLLWEISPSLFSHPKIFGFRRFAPSSLYENGMEFLTEVFSETVPQVLDSYAAKNADLPVLRPFYSFFEACFIRKVHETYGNILDNMPHDAIVIRKPTVQVYKEPREDALIPDTSLKEGMARRILGRESDDKKQTWIKTKLKRHGQTIYVLEKDVECQDKASIVDIDLITEQKAPGEADEQIMFSDTFDDCILSLLLLVEKLYARTQTKPGKGFSKRYGFQLLYTEKLLGWLKRIHKEYSGFPVRTPQHEQEAISVAETDFLDYLLTDICRTFSTIASTPLHAERDFPYLNSNSGEEIEIPDKDDKTKGKNKEKEEREKEKGIKAIIYVHFLTDIKLIQGKPNSLAVSFSKYRTEFNEQYALLYETNVNRSKDGGAAPVKGNRI